MPNRPPDYETLIQQKWQENAADVVNRLNADDAHLRQKMATYAENFGIDTKSIIRKIRTDQMFANSFAKDPNKQSLHEQSAAAYISNLQFVSEFINLPTHGMNAYYIAEGGEALSGSAKQGTIKTLDFTWKTGRFTCYAAHKYIKQSGGAQDNQFADILSALHRWSKGNAQPDEILFAIVDGPYFTTDKMRQLIQATRLERPLSFTLPISDLEVQLKQLHQLYS